tara:strand:+ start:3041 stop:3193 length:153 start_codon:yes stop_codon:yes gene_type:complete
MGWIYILIVYILILLYLINWNKCKKKKVIPVFVVVEATESDEHAVLVSYI